MDCYVLSLYLSLSLSDKPPTASVELCCKSGDMHSQKDIYTTGLVPVALSSCMFQFTIQDPVSHIQSSKSIY